MNKQELNALIDDFIEKKDTSLKAANQLELGIESLYPNNKYADDVVVCLASYRPEGGDFLYDENMMVQKLKEFRANVEK